MAVTTKNYNTGFPIYGAQGRVVKLVSDEQVTDNLRITRVVMLKNQPIGGVDADGKPRTEAQSVRVDFKNLSDESVDKLTVGSLIAFDGELMIRRFQPQGSTEWVSFPVIECWDFIKTAASKAERTANLPPVAAAAPVRSSTPSAPSTPAASYDDIPF